ncbi:MAG: DUF1573 domain-containing protein [Planctomycetes bacterium]|nr:DUF1573 domain-containing protein [Planctomycetota bacterium]
MKIELHLIFIGLCSMLCNNMTAVETDDAMQWDAMKHHIQAVVGQREHHVTYTFKNTHTESVHIKRVMSSCECMVAQLEKKNYAAGESGEVKAVLTPSADVGLLSQHIMVTYTVGAQERLWSSNLQFVVQQPSLYEISHKKCVWQRKNIQYTYDVQLKITDPAVMFVKLDDTIATSFDISLLDKQGQLIVEKGICPHTIRIKVKKEFVNRPPPMVFESLRLHFTHVHVELRPLDIPLIILP